MQTLSDRVVMAAFNPMPIVDTDIVTILKSQRNLLREIIYDGCGDNLQEKIIECMPTPLSTGLAKSLAERIEQSCSFSTMEEICTAIEVLDKKLLALCVATCCNIEVNRIIR